MDELAAEYNFTADETDILHQLLSPEMRPSLIQLCGGMPAEIVGGSLLWPLPGIHNITTYFGVPDAFGNPGHKGVDIAAAEGTPIKAAHGGTVMVAGWNNSYGNQVYIDSGTGLSSRYAHMISVAVSAGDTISAGQTIGYVGSTGNSTGNHLHFEVSQNGVLVDPLAFSE